MSCIVNPDLCPSGQISKSCKKGITTLCGPIDWKNTDKLLRCLQTKAPKLKAEPWNCYDLEKLPSCLECSLWTTDPVLPNLGSFCNTFSSLPFNMGPTACESAIPPSGSPSCCKWIGPTCGNTNCKVGQKCCAGNKCDYSCGGGGGGGGSTPISGKWVRISIVGGLLFTLVIGVVIWLIVRKKSK